MRFWKVLPQVSAFLAHNWVRARETSPKPRFNCRFFSLFVCILQWMQELKRNWTDWPCSLQTHFTTLSSSFSLLSIFLFILFFFTISPSHGVRTCYWCWPPWHIHTHLYAFALVCLFTTERREMSGVQERESMNMKDVIMQCGYLFPTVSEFLKYFSATKIWLVRENSTITRFCPI